MQKNIIFKRLLISSLVTLSFSSVAVAADADNSKENKRIEEKSEVTSQDQGDSDSDIKLTQRIRQEIVAIDSFSTDAKNVKIITSAGKVTLKGPVNSTAEKKQIESIANKVAGATKVVSEIKVDTK